MEAVLQRYLAARRLTSRPRTVERFSLSLRTFGTWVAQAYPAVRSFTEVDRAQVLAYIAALERMSTSRGRPIPADGASNGAKYAHSRSRRSLG
jgi:hypothetical protein